MRRSPLVLVLALLLAWASSVTILHAQSGTVRVMVGKAGLIVGAGGGRGTLTYRGRDYRFRVTGLSLGLTAGGSINRLTGEVSYLDDVKDFAGTYTSVGLGGALAGGIGGAQLRNDKGVMLTLRGAKAGLELSANLSNIRIAFE
jgi:hypothetical protein